MRPLSRVCLAALLICTVDATPPGWNNHHSHSTTESSSNDVNTDILCEDNGAPYNNEFFLKLECTRNNKVVNIVSADYGRTDMYECGDQSSHANVDTSCTSEESTTQIVKELCQDKRSCFLEAVNSLYGNPCGGTYKYLEVQWTCGAFFMWLRCRYPYTG